MGLQKFITGVRFVDHRAIARPLGTGTQRVTAILKGLKKKNGQQA
jgi:hypothetical protein